jgi:hypothetical protein
LNIYFIKKLVKMILIQQISNLDLEYIDDIKECLRHNVLNPIIETIVIFSNCKNFESSIKIYSKKIFIVLVLGFRFLRHFVTESF